MAERISQDLVRLADVPPATRLSSVVASLPGIVEGAKLEQQGDALSRKILDVFGYASPFQRDAHKVSLVVSFLTGEKTLTPKGTKPKIKGLPEIFDAIKPKAPEQESDKDQARKLGRRIARLLHPDTNDPIVKTAFVEEETRLDLYTSAVKVTEKPNLERGQRLFLDVMPLYYQTLLGELTKQGLSDAEIADAHPEMLRDLELLRYITHVREPVQTAARKIIGEGDTVAEVGEQ